MFEVPNLDELQNIPCTIVDSLSDWNDINTCNCKINIFHLNVRSLNSSWSELNIMFHKW